MRPHITVGVERDSMTLLRLVVWLLTRCKCSKLPLANLLRRAMAVTLATVTILLIYTSFHVHAHSDTYMALLSGISWNDTILNNGSLQTRKTTTTSGTSTSTTTTPIVVQETASDFNDDMRIPSFWPMDPTDPPTRTTPVPTSEAKLVLLLSYQRTGSSFIGDLLFNFNPDAFYVYEPLDPLYAAMFGVAQGWTVPSDITTLPNGKLRVPPKAELDAVASLLEHLLVCNMTSFPLEVYMHQLWGVFQGRMNVLSSYRTCMNSQKLLQGTLGKCQVFIKKLCGTKFAEAGRRQDLCFKHLWDHQPVAAGSNRHGNYSFEDYDRCVHSNSLRVKRCIPHLTQPCTVRPVRAVKTVRATMRSVESLLEKHPNFYVIHSYRDPRSTALSRKKAPWSHSAYERNGNANVSKIAHAHCQTVLDDFRKRKELEAKYPGRLMDLDHRELMQSPMKKIREIYAFLGLPIDCVLESQLRKHIDGRKMKLVSQKWKRQLKAADIKKTMIACKEFAAETGFNWYK